MEPSSSSYIEFDSQHEFSPSEQVQSKEDPPIDHNRRRPTSSTATSSSSRPYPIQIVRSFSNTLSRVQSIRSNNNLPPPTASITDTISSSPSSSLSSSSSTTSAQLQEATVRGEISATEEQVEIAKAQRERNAIRYHAEEAVKAGNDNAEAAAVKMKDDPGYWITDHPDGSFGGGSSGSCSSSVTNNKPPLLKKVTMASDGGCRMTSSRPMMQRSTVSKSVNGSSTDNGNGSDANGSKMRIPWVATQSIKNTFLSSNKTTKKLKVVDNDNDDDNGNGNSNLEETVTRMKQNVLMESHNRSGALFLLECATTTIDDERQQQQQQPDSKARARVKFIIEHTDQAEAYIRMGLQHDLDMDTMQMIRMIDYYCN